MKILLFFVSLLMASTQSFAISCDQYEPPRSFNESTSRIDEEIRKFSNKKEIAKRADDTLAKLIEAKSATIASWMSKRDLVSKSEDEIAREWRSYFARNFILTKYPHGDVGVDTAIEALMLEVNKIFPSKAFRNRIELLFERAKKQSLIAVRSFPIGEEQKKKISRRIQSIRIYWMKDFKKSKFSSFPMEFLDWGVAYDPVANEINIGVHSLAYPNDETYLAVFSHEIGHSFDSCRWSAFFEESWPFEAIGECLRKAESVGAKKRDDSKMHLLEKANSELAKSLKANPTCNKLGYPPSGLQSDQLAEAFADWFSAETMASFIGLNSSMLRADLCSRRELTEGSSYPSNDLRLGAIYFSHPKLKDKSKESAFVYCGWGTPPPPKK